MQLLTSCRMWHVTCRKYVEQCDLRPEACDLLLFIHNRKVATPPTLADRTLQHDLLAQYLFDHAPLHGADTGVLLGNIEVWAGKQLEAIVLGPQLDRDAAPLQRRT